MEDGSYGGAYSETASSIATLDLCFKRGEMAIDTGVLKFHITRILKIKKNCKFFFLRRVQKNKMCVSTQRKSLYTCQKNVSRSVSNIIHLHKNYIHVKQPCF